MSAYFKCSVCNKETFLFPNQLSDGKPKKPPVCIDCYVPENPTFGWMLSQAQKRSDFNFLQWQSLPETRREPFLKKFLKIKIDKNLEESENTAYQDR